MEQNKEQLKGRRRGWLDVVMYLVAFIVIQMVVASGISGLWNAVSPESGQTVQMIVSIAVFSVLTVAVFLAAGWCVVSPAYLRTRSWGVFFWSAMAAVGAIIPSTWLQEQLPELPNIVGEELELVLKERWGYVAVGLLAPFAEEVVFRGAVLRALFSVLKRPWPAIAVSAVLFALVHGNPAQMPHAFLVGLLLGWMCWRTGSILPGVAYHWVNNSVAYVLVNILPDPEAPLVEIFHGDSRAVLLSVLFSLMILLPSIFQLSVLMRKSRT